MSHKPVAALTDEELVRQKQTAVRTSEGVEKERVAHFLQAPSHGLAADILYEKLGDTFIFERFDTRGAGRFYARIKGHCYYEPVYDARSQARGILETAVTRAFEAARATDDDVKGLYEAAGKAYQKCRTVDFLSSALSLFAESVTVPDISWNATPEAHPTLTGVVDFSGERIEIRDAYQQEYFKDPVPVRAEDVVHGGNTDNFDQFLTELFPEPNTRQTALHCLALAIANRATKVFQIWQNNEGNGGKNSLADVLVMALPNRAVYASGSIILHRADQGERRFGAAVLRGATAAIVDEAGGAFDIAAVKRLTNLSYLRVESKGRDSIDIPQTWALIALSNELPSFYPADDQAFISRLLVLPFQTVFYADEAERERYVNYGVEPERLRPAKDKSAVLRNIEPERAAILHKLVTEYQSMRDFNGGRPFESEACRRAKNDYRSENDIVEQFFKEHMQRDDGGTVELSRVAELYADFVGHKKTTTRKLSMELRRRFRFLDTTKRNGKTLLTGATERGTA